MIKALSVLPLVAAIACVPVGAVFAQPVEFEVASVKPFLSPLPQGSTGMPPTISGALGTLNYSHVTFKGLLVRAYDVRVDAITGPAWMESKLYDISAKVPTSARADQVPVMLQHLLATRFRLRAHLETRDRTGYALVVGKAGLRLKPLVNPGPPSLSMESSSQGVSVSYKSNSMDRFAQSLTVDLGRPVVNMTQTGGLFDIELEHAFESMPIGTGADPGSSIFVAVRRLGLDLAPQKVPGKRLIVDSADSVPTEN